MPASTRLLQKIKEAWGDDLTQDLVAWVNEAQTVNRAELRELADVYFASLGTLVDERIAAAEARLELKLGTRLDERLAAFQARLEAGFEARLDQRIAASEAKFEAKLDQRIGASEAKLDQRINGVQLDIAGLRAEVAIQMRDQMKWMFVFWTGTVVPLAGLILALGKGWL